MNNNINIIEFTKEYIDDVIEFEKKLREEEPDTYFTKIDDEYRKHIEASFEDSRFRTATSLLALKNGKVIGRIEAVLIVSRTDALCDSAYLDWICVLKSERHNAVAQKLLSNLRARLKDKNVGLLVALMAHNEESLKFYKSLENARIHDEGIWMDI